MATFSKTGANGYSLILTVNETSYSVSNNTSTVSWALQLRATNKFYQVNTTTRKAYIDGVRVLNASSQLSFPGLNSTITLGSGTRTVSHNADGSKTISVSGSVSTGTGFYLPGAISVSGSLKLTTIPRKSSISTDKYGYVYGQTMYFTINRASSSFRHSISLGVDRKDGMGGHNWETMVDKTSSSSWSWTIPKSWAAYMPALGMPLRIKLDTYSGDTLIGVDVIERNVYPSDDMKPTVTVSVSDVKGYESYFGGFVRLKSQVKATSSTSFYRGSKGKSYSVNIGSEKFRSSSGTAKNPIQTMSLTVKASTTDTRNATGTTSKTLTIYDWFSPKINKFNTGRCSSDGQDDPDGAFIKVDYDISIAPVNSKNTKAVELRYRRQSASTWTTKTISGSSYRLIGSKILPASTESSWIIALYVKDYFTSVMQTRQEGTAFSLMDFHKSGTGMAFGKVAESADLIEFGLPIRGGFEDITSKIQNPGGITNFKVYRFGPLVSMQFRYKPTKVGFSEILIKGLPKPKDHWPLSTGTSQTQRDNFSASGYVSSAGNVFVVCSSIPDYEVLFSATYITTD